MFQSFQNTSVFVLVGAIVLLVLAVACSTPAPTATPVPTPTPTAVPTPTPASATGNWFEKRDEKDPISDSTMISILLKASDFEFSGQSPVIQAFCLEAPGDGTSLLGVAIDWGQFLGLDDPRVDWRVDDAEAKTWKWNLIGESGITTQTGLLLADLKRANKITARVHRDFAESLTAVWHPEGFAEAYKPVEEACKQ